FALPAECSVNGRDARIEASNEERTRKRAEKRRCARAPIEAPRVLLHEADPMIPPVGRFLQSVMFVLGLVASPFTSARALICAAPDSRFADRVAMVLIRGGDKAGFCSALVLSPRILLTAAHCLRPLRDIAVHYRDAAGAAVIIPVDAAIAHPPYRADAIQARA